MQKGLIRKGLVLSVIVLFIGVGIQPVFANDVSVSKYKIEENNDLYNGDFGYIECKVERMNYPYIADFFWADLICEDLDTGQIRYGMTNLFGIHRFFLLQKGHDYLIRENMMWWWSTDVLIEDLGDKGNAYLFMNPYYSKTIDNSFLERFPLFNLLLQRVRI